MAATLLGASVACGPLSPSTEAPVKTSDDRKGLTRHITVPEVLGTVRWAAHARGTVGLGPTDLELVAAFPVPEADRAAVDAVVGVEGDVREFVVPDTLARALELQLPIRGRKIRGGPFENSSWSCNGAVWTDDGLVVWMTSR